MVAKNNPTLTSMMKSFAKLTMVPDHQQAILEGKVENPISTCRQNNSEHARINPFTTLVEPLVESGAVTVIDSATVERIMLRDNRIAEGVIFSVPKAGAFAGKKKIRSFFEVIFKLRFSVQANKEVILCAGAFGSPQLLMLSGIGPKQELLKHDIPCRVELPVGEQLMDHVFTLTAAFLKQPAVTTDGSLLDCTGFYKSDWSKEVEPKRGRDMQVLIFLLFVGFIFIGFILGGDVFQSPPSL
jgi:choline dehydrogenase-like flavoprotein